MTITLVPQCVDSLTLDDPEQLAFRYGGTVERHGDKYRLVGAVVDGRRIATIGPVAA